MAESNRANRFIAFLSRIRSTRPLDRSDSQSITHLAVSEHISREEQPIQYTHQEAAYEEFLTTGLQTFPSEDAGLQSLGWKFLAPRCGPQLPQGSFATIRMAYKLSDRGTPLESRHLAVAKIQYVDQKAWAEVQILKGLVHENIVDLYGVFAVDPARRSDEGVSYRSRIPEKRVLWLLLEYANAGDLEKEAKRYPNMCIHENGARYYMLQVCAGLEHIHSRRVIHRDIHAGNILLKYKPDGTKICMICDFGISVILGPHDELDAHTGYDVSGVCSMLYFLMQHNQNVSEECLQVTNFHFQFDDEDSKPKSVNELLAYPWFKIPAVPPIPKAPTPLLRPEAVREIGYLPPMDPAGTTSPLTEPQFGPMTRHDSRPASLAQRMRQNLRAVRGHVAARVRSLTGRDRQPSSEHGREQVAPVARSPSKESSRVREHHWEDKPHGAAEAEPDRPSRSSRVRDRLTSMGRAIARPFRSSYRRHED